MSDASVPASTVADCTAEASVQASILSVVYDDARLTDGPPPLLPPPPPPAAPTPPAAFRVVTIQELVLHPDLDLGKKGPPPRDEVMLLANAIARDRMSGGTASVRSVAKAHQWCTKSGKTACPSTPVPKSSKEPRVRVFTSIPLTPPLVHPPRCVQAGTGPVQSIMRTASCGFCCPSRAAALHPARSARRHCHPRHLPPPIRHRRGSRLCRRPSHAVAHGRSSS